MAFDPHAYGDPVARILALDGNGARLMPLVAGACSSPLARDALRAAAATALFPHSRAPEAALAGLWLYFSAFDEAHAIAQAIDTAEGSFWHAIAHRQEPDAGNSAYWFRRVGRHPVFPALRDAASAAGMQLGSHWDPFAFIDLCGKARNQPGSSLEKLALEVQRAEWQLLFDYCAAPV